MAAAAATATALLGVTSAAHADSARITAVASSTPQAVNGATVSQYLRYAVKHLPGAPAQPAGYARSLFKLWDDADHDCRDTRAEVLAAESTYKTNAGCTIQYGAWHSYYDDTYFSDPSKLDIDHMVPLAEAWASGARSWSSATREAYANDLSDPRTLIAVSAHANRSKGDRDVAHWLPEYGACKYVGQWVAVKLRWHLSVDPLERQALVHDAAACSNVRITTHRARVVLAAAPSTPTPDPSTPAPSTPAPSTPTTTPSPTEPTPSPTPSHACTTTSSGSCIRGGAFCPQASYGQVGYDAYGNQYVCSGDRTHPHWS